MSEVKSKVKDMSSSSLLVPGRCRLLGAAVSFLTSNAEETGGRVTPSNGGYDGSLAATTIVMKNGSTTGEELFSFAIPVGWWAWDQGTIPYMFMFGDGYIEFDSGIFIDAWSNTGVGKPIPGKTNIYVYYEGA